MPLPSVLLPCGSSLLVTTVPASSTSGHGHPLAADQCLDEAVVPALLDEVPGPEVRATVTGAGHVDVEDVVGLALVAGVPVRRRRCAGRPGRSPHRRARRRRSGPGCGTLDLQAERQSRRRLRVGPLVPLGCRLGALAAAAAVPELVVRDVDRPRREGRVAEVDGLDVEPRRVLVVEVDRDRPVLEQLLGGAQAGAGLRVVRRRSRSARRPCRRPGSRRSA